MFAVDSITYNKETRFTTWDGDSGLKPTDRRYDAWWCGHCQMSKFNATENRASDWMDVDCQHWPRSGSLVSTEMKIRPMHFETGMWFHSDNNNTP